MTRSDEDLRFSSAFEKAVVGIVFSDLSGRIVRANEHFCKLLGYEASELVGRLFSELTHVEDLERDRAAIDRFAADELRSLSWEKRYIRKDGSPIHVRVDLSRDNAPPAGEPYSIVIVTDISVQKAAESASSASESRYRDLMEQAVDGIFVTDPQLIIIDVNLAGCALVAGTRQEVLGLNLLDLVETKDPAGRQAAFDALARGETVRVERTMLQRSGARVSIELNARQLNGGGVQAIVRDITERKKAEELLRASQDRFLMVAKATNDGIYDWDIAAGTVWWSETFRRAFGVSDDQNPTSLEWWSSRIHPDEREQALSTQRAAVGGTERAWVHEYRFLEPDGSYSNVLDRGIIVRDGSGTAVRMVGTMMDVTRERQAEEKLRRSEARFRRLFESNIIGLLYTRSDGSIVEANDAFLAMVGYDRQDLTEGRLNWRRLTAPEFSYCDEAAIREVREKGIAELFEKEYVRRNGTRVPVLAGVAGLDQDGDVEFVTFVIDLSPVKSAQAALGESEDRFRALIENGTEIFMIVDPEGVVRYSSPSLQRVLGYHADEQNGRPVFDTVHPDDLDRVQRTFFTHAGTPGAIAREKFRSQHKDGSWRQLETIGRNMTDHPAVKGIVVTSRDVTERDLFETQLAQAERLAGLGRLAATVAHDFNNVLMGIQPFTEVVARLGKNDPRLQQAAEHIERSLQRGKRITMDILRFTQPAEPAKARIEVTSWLGGAVTEMRAMLGAGIVITMDPLPSPVDIVGDRAQLMQVMMNLALNARDAMSGGGTLRITVDEPRGQVIYPFALIQDAGRFVHIAVSDTGKGIAPEHSNRIFEPLFTTKKSGSGLGLAVAHQVITRHGGQIFAESRRGEGATLHLFLPKAGDTPFVEKPPAEVRTAHSSEAARRRVLLIEDEVAVASGIAALLSLEDYEVEIVTRGAEAVDRIEVFQPDAVILDVGLPDIDGAEVYRRIAAVWPDLPVVFSTGHADRALLEEFLVKPNVAFLQKPYDFDALQSLLRDVLGR